ncbi:hypothetical protein SUGI_0122750 [Cryptomeria japonica]|nr:hypothetical protein SUGI_0122750 [Cryptomeria japonica]
MKHIYQEADSNDEERDNGGEGGDARTMNYYDCDDSFIDDSDTRSSLPLHVSSLEGSSSPAGSCESSSLVLTNPPLGIVESPSLPCSPSYSVHTLRSPSPTYHVLDNVLLLSCSSIPLSSRNWESKLVANLSHANLDPLVFNFLKRGLGFAVALRAIPLVDFLTNIENAVRALPTDVAKEIRQDCAVALRWAKPPKCNIPKA